jgi:hypothetical protein
MFMCLTKPKPQAELFEYEVGCGTIIEGNTYVLSNNLQFSLEK